MHIEKIAIFIYNVYRIQHPMDLWIRGAVKTWLCNYCKDLKKDCVGEAEI